MSKNVWLITGAVRGIGVEFVKAALAAGHAVVASDRDIDRVSKALGAVERSTARQARRHEPR